MNKAPKLHQNQSGIVHLAVIVVVVLIIVVVIISIASGSLKFSASITDTSSNNAQQSGQTPSVPESKPKAYQNEKYGIALEYPASWSLKESPAESYIVAFFSPKDSESDTYLENLGVKAIDVSAQPDITLQEVADLWENQTKEAVPTFSVVERKSSTLSGEATMDLVYTFQESEGAAKGMTKMTLKNNTAYIFQFSALETGYTKYLSDIEAILASVRF